MTREEVISSIYAWEGAFASEFLAYEDEYAEHNAEVKSVIDAIKEHWPETANPANPANPERLPPQPDRA